MKKTPNSPEALPQLSWEEKGVRHEMLVDQRITIGRAAENLIVFNDVLVSRYHCVVSATSQGYSVQDLDSANGTFVNGELVSGARQLQAGDRLKVGNFEMIFEQKESPPATMSKGVLVWEMNGQETRLEVGEGLAMGRSKENDVVIDDMQASRFHCRVEPVSYDPLGTQSDFVLIDLGSTNGTFLNEGRVQDRMPIQDGDNVRVGNSRYRFTLLSAEMLEATLQIEVSDVEATPPSPPPPVSVSPPKEEVELPLVSPPVKSPTAPLTTAALIEVQDIIKDFDSPGGKVRILKGISLQVSSGEFVGIRGPSGSGKSTLLNMITGIDRPSAGEVVVAGQSLNQLNENKMARWRGNTIGVIFQFFQLLPTLTIIENIMLPMDFCRKWKPRERQERGMDLLEQVDLSDQAFKLPSMLSGGQQQRAAIARALANDPPLVVADEPTGNLDSKTADRVFQLFQNLVTRGITFLMVTHDTELAKRFPRVLEVLDGELYERRN